MTLTDIRRNIIESTHPQWFNEIYSKLIFNYDESEIPFKGISALYEYVLKQIDGWEKHGENIPKELINSRNYFTQLKNQIIQFVNRNKQGDINQLNSNWASINTKIIHKEHNVFKFNSVEVSFLLKVFQDYPKSFIHAYNFIINPNNINITNKDSLLGNLLAYEFSEKAVGAIVKRSNLERSSFKAIKNEIEQHISEAETQLVEHLKDSKKKYQDYSYKIDETKVKIESEYLVWFKDVKESFEAFTKVSNDNINTLEATYEELLSLKKPADYWKTRAIELNKEGWIAIKWLVALIVLACLVLYSLLWLTPEGMLKSFFGNDKTSALRWAIIFITLISFLAYGIKALTKVAFSSFHLSRDAEERERLTYVYLAMIKDSSIDKEDRHLIMQSLFSRADTGLLKEDSSPTMPGAFVEKVIR